MLKKEKTIIGTLVVPITVGQPALILDHGAHMQTSIVQSILHRSDRLIVFETLNTIYRLNIDTSANLNSCFIAGIEGIAFTDSEKPLNA